MSLARKAVFGGLLVAGIALLIYAGVSWQGWPALIGGAHVLSSLLTAWDDGRGQSACRYPGPGAPLGKFLE